MRTGRGVVSILLVQAAVVLATADSSLHGMQQGQPGPGPGRESGLALTNLTVIDGTGSAPSPNLTVVVSNGRIVARYPTGSKPIPPGFRVLDLSGRYAIPGFIDAHVHVATDPQGRDANAAEQLRGAFLGGVTAVRDMAGDAVVLADLAKHSQSAEAESPRLYFSALMAGPTFFEDPRTKASAHGATPGEAAWLRAITLETDLRAVVTAAKATGATGIKIYGDLPAAILTRVTAEGHRQGLRVWSHATVFPARPGDAVDAGVDVISHAILLYFESAPQVPERYHRRPVSAMYDSVSVDTGRVVVLLQRMRDRGTVLDATLLVSSRLETAPPGTSGLADPRRAVEWMYAVTRRAKQLGVTVAAGTEGMMPGNLSELPNLHREMELLVTRAGFSPLEAITAATLNSARALGMDQQLGTIAVGKVADLVILTADPTADIRNTRQIELVIKGGVIHRRM